MHRLLPLILLALALHAQGPQQLLSSGEASLAKGDLRAAIESFRAAANAAGADERFTALFQTAAVRLAEARALIGETDAAESTLRQIQERVPANSELAARLQLVQAGLKRFRGDWGGAAEDALTASVSLAKSNSPHTANAVAEQAWIAMELAGWPEAARLLNDLAKLPADQRTEANFQVPAMAARHALLTGDYAAIDVTLSTTPATTPAHTLLLTFQGRARAAQDQPTAAQQILQPACDTLERTLSRTHGDVNDCLLALGEVLLDLDQPAAAITVYERVAANTARYTSTGHPLSALRSLVRARTLAARNQGTREAHLEALTALVALYGEKSPRSLAARVELAQYAPPRERLNVLREAWKSLDGLRDFRKGHVLRRRMRAALIRAALDSSDTPTAMSAAAEYMDELPTTAEDRMDTVVVRELMGNALLEGKRYQDAEQMLVRAWTMRAKRAKSGGYSPYFQTTFRVATARANLKRPAEALTLLNEAINASPREYAALPALDRARAESLRSSLAAQLNQTSLALSSLREAVRIQRATPAARIATYESDVDQLARLLAAQKQFAEAAPLLREAFAARTRANTADSDDGLKIAFALAQAEQQANQLAEAVTLWDRVLQASYAGRGPGTRDRPGLIRLLAEANEKLQRGDKAAEQFQQLALLSLNQGKYDDAKALAQRAAKLSANNSSGRAAAEILEANILLVQNQPDNAEKLLNTAVQTPGLDASNRALAYAGLVRVSIQRRDLDNAARLATEAAALPMDTLSPYPKSQLVASRALLEVAQGKKTEADASYTQLLQSFTAYDPQRDPPYADLLAEAVRYYSPQGRTDKVEEISKSRVEASARSFGAQSADAAWAVHALGEFYVSQKRYQEAYSLYEQALAIFNRTKGQGSAESVVVLTSVADAFRAQGDAKAALTTYQRAANEAGAADAMTQGSLLNQIGGIQLSQAQYADAAATYAKLAALYQANNALPNSYTALRQRCVALIQAADPAATPELARLRQTIRAANANKDSLAELDVLRAVLDPLKQRKAKEAGAVERDLRRMERSLKVN
jgi:tetratricopeptide (TPR) repeat protein